MLEPVIRRDEAGLAIGEFCVETEDGGVDLYQPCNQDPSLAYGVSLDRIDSPAAFAETYFALCEKRWFHDAMARELTLIMAARWLGLSDSPAMRQAD